jgi:hypothetical protein
MGRASEADVRKLALLQPGVLRFRLHQDRNVRVGVFPDGEKIPVRKLCLDPVPGERECSADPVPGERECSAQLQVCQSTNRIRADDPAMIEDLLKRIGNISGASLVDGMPAIGPRAPALPAPPATASLVDGMPAIGPRAPALPAPPATAQISRPSRADYDSGRGLVKRATRTCC